MLRGNDTRAFYLCDGGPDNKGRIMSGWSLATKSRSGTRKVRARSSNNVLAWGAVKTVSPLCC